MTDSGILNSNQTPGIDVEGGIELGQIRPGIILEVHTRNSTYTVIPQASGQLVWGHPEYCPQPTLVTGLGATYENGHFREGYLAPGTRLSFPIDGRRVSTSRIVAIREKKKN
ncbi:MAG: hypothetical protein ACKV2U_20490 [Bryobacteraceae bacterium]